MEGTCRWASETGARSGNSEARPSKAGLVLWSDGRGLGLLISAVCSCDEEFMGDFGCTMAENGVGGLWIIPPFCNIRYYSLSCVRAGGRAGG